MAAVIPTGTTAWGLQLPIQSQSTVFVQPWEAGCGAEELRGIVQAAEDAGAFYVAVCDHVGIPRPADEAMSGTWYDTIATLGWIAGFTRSVHLLSHVYVLAYRHPMVVAKAFCTLDHLSGGRAILGAGAGHLESEFEMLGVDFASRGRSVEAAVPIIRSAFEQEYPQVDVGGDLTDVAVSPRPAREGGPPIWIGGSSAVAIERAALLGDGWLPQGRPKMGTRAAIEWIHDLRAEASLPERFDLGVNCEPVHLGPRTDDMAEWTLTGSADEVAERLRRYVSLGINQLQVRFPATDPHGYEEQLQRFGEEVAPLIQP
ncbi:MAG: LLM class flavin-dependent oxidoreductase [Microthrixaceae bacterium]